MAWCSVKAQGKMWDKLDVVFKTEKLSSTMGRCMKANIDFMRCRHSCCKAI
jgi:hypothetical protein